MLVGGRKVVQSSSIEISAKIVILKLRYPLTQFPELTSALSEFEHVVRIPESVYVIRTPLTPGDLCDKLSVLIQDRGTVFVGRLCSPYKLHGGDVSLNQVMGLVTPVK